MADLQQLVRILESENRVLDHILEEQDKLHQNVKEKNWVCLNDNITQLGFLSNDFVALDSERESIASMDNGMYYSDSVKDLLFEVRSKLTKSKIENEALNMYVQSTQAFVSKVLDECIPQQRNTLYTSKGNIRRATRESILVNKVF